MLPTLAEKKMHVIRWAVLLAWGLLITSLFYDPFSAILTDPANTWSWLADQSIATATDSASCVSTQGYCVPLEPYPIGARVFWGMVVPSAIFIVLVFGHEFWRRICPLYFFSQLPRALGMAPLLDIQQSTWLQRNHFYVQFFLFFLGITARILLVNSVRPVLGVFFIFTLLSAAGVVALYGGRSWCHYVCPFGMVQTVFTGPRGLLDSEAHKAPPYSITQSMCRTADGQGTEQSTCISCKSACMDIDSEQSYWEQLHSPGRKLVQYGYLGLVIGYFCYYGLYAGNFKYYFSGVWSHESRTLTALIDAGFYIAGQSIGIPKIIAAPLTLALFAAVSCAVCSRLERFYRGYLKRKYGGTTTIDIPEQSLHRMFSICTFVAFNFFFIYGGRPEINNWPIAAQFAFQAVIAMVSSLWLYRTWGRSRTQYEKESLVDKLRRQLKKMPMVPDLLGSHALEQLNAEELNILAKTLPNIEPPVVQTPESRPFQDVPRTIIRRKRAKKSSENQMPQTQLRK